MGLINILIIYTKLIKKTVKQEEKMSKAKKKNTTKMDLGAFLASGPTAAGGLSSSSAGGDKAASNMVRINWAEEMENLDDDAPNPDFIFDRSQLPSATKAQLGPDIDMNLVPTRPPFTAHISNVSFEADEEKVRAFFKEEKVVKVNLITDESGRPKGFGFVEFETRESLLTALGKTNTQLHTKVVKITLDDQQGKRDGGRYGRGGGGAESTFDEDSAWTRKETPASGGGDFQRGEPASGAQQDVTSMSFSDYARSQGGGGRGDNRDNDRQGGGRYGGGGDRYGGDRGGQQRYGGGGDRDRNYGGGDRDQQGGGYRGGGGYNRDRDGGGYGGQRGGNRDNGGWIERGGGRHGGGSRQQYGDRNERQYGDRSDEQHQRSSYNRTERPEGAEPD